MSPDGHRIHLPMLAVLIIVAVAGAASVAAAPNTVNVDCSNKTIADALTKKNPDEPLEVIVSGTCTENVLLIRDDVTLRALAPGSGAVHAANAGAATILIDGARRVRLDNLTISGGAGGIVGRRGASFDVTNCVVENNTGFGVVASSGATGTLDNCQVRATTGDGVLAANGFIVVTNSTVENNTGNGITGVRNAQVRVGQDFNGTPMVKPVTIRNNGRNNLLITDSSAAILVGGVVENSGAGSPGVAVTRASTAQIGVGLFGLMAATTVQNNGRQGIFLEGSYATVLNTTISGNADVGIQITNSGGARIGILNDSTAYAGNTITNNGSTGILISDSASAFIGGNAISANGTNPLSRFIRAGIAVFQASANLGGNNVIQNNPASGIFVGRAGSAIVGNAGFGLPTSNTISGNGFGDPTKGGVQAFQGGVIDVRDATISGNHGGGALASQNAVIELRDSDVTANVFASAGFNGGHGVMADLRSTVRLRLATDVSGNQGDGVRIVDGSAVVFAFETPPAPSTVNGNAGFGLNCFGTESSFRGDTSGIGPNTSGAISPSCTGF